MNSNARHFHTMFLLFALLAAIHVDTTAQAGSIEVGYDFGQAPFDVAPFFTTPSGPVAPNVGLYGTGGFTTTFENYAYQFTNHYEGSIFNDGIGLATTAVGRTAQEDALALITSFGPPVTAISFEWLAPAYLNGTGETLYVKYYNGSTYTQAGADNQSFAASPTSIGGIFDLQLPGGLGPQGFDIYVIDNATGEYNDLAINKLTFTLGGVPEPSSLVLASIGLVGICVLSARRRDTAG